MRSERYLPLLFFLLILSGLMMTGCNLPEPPVIPPTNLQVYTETPAMIPPTETPYPTVTMAPAVTAAEILPAESLFTSVPTAAEPTPDPNYFHGSLWYEPEFVSQDGLLYQGRKTSAGCTAASVQMVLEFWHSYKEEYPVMTAQTLIDRNTWQRRFDPKTGLNIMDTEDELREMHYYLGSRLDSSKEELLTALERYGPLLVLTKVNWNPYGANHMAVVTGYDPEEDLIRVLDPWQLGGIMEFPYDNFDGIWGLNYLDDPVETLRRSFFFIVPYAELHQENEPFIPLYDMNIIFDREGNEE